MSDETKLDDATVRALVEAEVEWSDHAGVWFRDMSRPLPAIGRDDEDDVTPVVRALAREVLARREQRCGTCVAWTRVGPYAGTCDFQRDRLTTVEHYCADWQATEAGR